MKRKNVSLGETSTAILRGEADYSEWTDEELIRGQRKSRRGKWEGQPPKVVPLALLHELNRRIAPEVHRDLLKGAQEGARYLRAVAAGEEEADQGRMHAAEVCLNRTYGMASQSVKLEMNIAPSPYEQAGVQKAIVLRRAIDVESEEVDNPFWVGPEPPSPTPHSLSPAVADPDENDPFEPEENPFEDTGNPVVKGRPTRKHRG